MTEIDGKLRERVVRLEADVARLSKDNEGLYRLNGRMGLLLTGVADGLRGQNPSMLRDWAGLPADAEEIRQILTEALDAADRAQTSDVEAEAFKTGLQTLAKHLELM